MNNSEIFFYILIRHYKSFTYFDRCIDSVLQQTYRNYKILFVDDASGYSKERKRYIKNKLKNHIVIFNRDRKFSLFNAYYMIHKYATKSNAIVFNLDGDDWLIDAYVLRYVAKVYKTSNFQITYGECVFWNGNNTSLESRFIQAKTNICYPKKVVYSNTYRLYPFLPLHPRTWRVELFNKIKKDDFLDSKGNFLKFAEDQAMFYPMLEMSKGNYKCIKKPLYVYNTININSDIKKNIFRLLKDEILIRMKGSYV